MYSIKGHCLGFALAHLFVSLMRFALKLPTSISLMPYTQLFAPAVGRTFWYLLRPTAALSLPRIGVLEIVYSTIFLVLVWLAYARS
ncbi:MAG: hypothetical protein NZ823_01535 [Blastocatellia bacterium]|nr:hypothetical protein [Blastocatellia bacterium]